jgi:hypothetical protein
VRGDRGVRRLRELPEDVRDGAVYGVLAEQGIAASLRARWVGGARELVVGFEP